MIFCSFRALTGQQEACVRPQASEQERLQRLFDATVAAAARDGWSCVRVQDIAPAAGEDPDEMSLRFPGGAGDILRRWLAATVDGVEAALRQDDLSALKVRDRVRVAAERVLGALEPYAGALRGALATPGNAAVGPWLWWRAADAVWSGVNDRSVDMNWYSKRGTLMAVFAATALVFLTPGGDWRAFLARRIEDVMAFETVKRRLAGRVSGRRAGGAR
jgi:ubiquinone biosynthesis protein COQ9